MLEKIRIRNARVYDPSQGWRGEIRDLDLAGGRVSPPLALPDRVIDAEGRPLLAGGIEPCCWAAAPGQALFRLLAGFPAPEEIGRTYARLGYVHLHHPFTGLLTAGLVQRAFDLIPYVDTSTCVTIDLRDLGTLIRANQPGDFCRQARGLVRAAGAIGLSLPLPCLRHRQRQYLQKNLSAAKVLSFLSRLEDPGLVPVHLWGFPELLDEEIPEPGRFHICGLNAALGDESSLERAALFLDAGGSADLGLGTGEEEFVVETAPGVGPGTISLDAGFPSPLHLRTKREPPDSFRAGWKLLARAKPSWRLALGAAGAGAGRPGCLAAAATWLLAPESRPLELRDTIKEIRFDFEDYALRTRLLPARLLGIEALGHLGAGARACVAIYDLPADGGKNLTESTFRDCWCLIKDGVPVRERGEFTGLQPPRQTRTRPLEADLEELTRAEAFQNQTVRAENLWVGGQRAAEP